MTDKMIKRSVVDEFVSTLSGAQAFAAAKLALKIVRLLMLAKSASKISNHDLAAKLEVTDGRVSQVMNGDGNIHIATLARFMHAMGYEVQVSAEPLEVEMPKIGSRPRRIRNRTAPASEPARFDVYEQKFLTGHGVVTMPMFVPTDDVLGCVPEGGPSRVGHAHVTFEEEGSGKIPSFSQGPSRWSAKPSMPVVLT